MGVPGVREAPKFLATGRLVGSQLCGRKLKLVSATDVSIHHLDVGGQPLTF